MGKFAEPQVVALAGSAGGINALRTLLSALPARFPLPLLCWQHIGAKSQLVDILAFHTPLRVRWVHGDEEIRAGTVYISPPGSHIVAQEDGTLSLSVALRNQLGGLQDVDCFLQSVAQSYGKNSLAIILTGVGGDGARGACAVRKAGGTVWVQDQATSQFWGMAQAAVQAGGTDRELPLAEIGPALVKYARALPSTTVLTPAACTLRRALKGVLRSAVAMLGTDLGYLQLCDAGQASLTIVAQCGFKQAFLDHFSSADAEDGSICGRAMAHGARVAVENLESDSLFAPHQATTSAAGPRSMQSTPLIGEDGEVIGVLSTHLRVTHRLSMNERRQLDEYARRAVDLLEHCPGNSAALRRTLGRARL